MSNNRSSVPAMGAQGAQSPSLWSGVASSIFDRPMTDLGSSAGNTPPSVPSSQPAMAGQQTDPAPPAPGYSPWLLTARPAMTGIPPTNIQGGQHYAPAPANLPPQASWAGNQGYSPWSHGPAFNQPRPWQDNQGHHQFGGMQPWSAPQSAAPGTGWQDNSGHSQWSDMADYAARVSPVAATVLGRNQQPIADPNQLHAQQFGPAPGTGWQSAPAAPMRDNNGAMMDQPNPPPTAQPSPYAAQQFANSPLASALARFRSNG